MAHGAETHKKNFKWNGWLIGSQIIEVKTGTSIKNFSHWISISEMVLPGPGFSPSSIEFKLAD